MLACHLPYPITLYVLDSLMLFWSPKNGIFSCQQCCFSCSFFPRHVSCVLAGCLSVCIPYAYLVLCCNLLLPRCLLWANNYVLFACLVIMLLTFLVRCLYIPSMLLHIIDCCYNILVCLCLCRRKVKINYILINAFVIHRCHMWLLWLWQICEKEGKKNIDKVEHWYILFPENWFFIITLWHHQECCRQSLYCIGGDRENIAS